MATLDSDVRSLINHLWFYVSDTWDNMMKFLWSPDTKPQADLWLRDKSMSNSVELKDEIRTFVEETDKQMENLPGGDFVFGYPIRSEPRKPGELRPCFLAMPTRSWLPDVQAAIQSAAVGFQCILSVDNRKPGDIMDQVWQDIRSSDVVVADMTGQNANVFYEMGLAHALGKLIILIKQQDSPPVPFDLSNHRYVEYDTQDLATLETELSKAFRAVPKRYKFDRMSKS